MDPISHAVFAHLLTGQTLSWGLVAGSLVPDLDKVVTYARGDFTGAESRTWWQEFPAMSALTILLGLAGLWRVAQGVVAHVTLDFLTGETRPLSPFSDKRIDFNLSFSKKVALGVILWASYLGSLMLF